MSSRWLQRTNWCQGMEGEIDTAHISFLHRWMDSSQRPFRANQPRRPAQQDGAPEVTLKETDYGFTYGARRNADQ